MLILAGLPLFSWRGHYSPFEVPKTWIIIILSGLSTILAIIINRPIKKIGYHKKLLAMIVVLWSWLLMSSVMNGDFWQSWWGNPYRGDGLLTVLAMMSLGLTLTIMPKLWSWIAIVNVVMSCLVLLNGQVDFALTMGSSNMLSGYLAVTLPLVDNWAKKNKWILILPIMAIGLIGSWGGILIAVVFVLVKLLSAYPKWMIASLCVGIISVIWMYHHDYQQKALPGYIVAESRERILIKAVIAIQQKPILGWGWTQFGSAFTQIDYPKHFLVDAYVDRTHASILEMGVAGGIPALMLYVTIVGISIKSLLLSNNKFDQILGCVLILYLIHSQTNITSVAEDWLLWVGVGRSVSLPSRDQLS